MEMCQKVYKVYYCYQKKEKETLQEQHNLKMMPITPNTLLELNIRIQKIEEEKEINTCACEKFLRKKYRNSSFILHNRLSLFPPGRDEKSPNHPPTYEITSI